MAWKPFVLYNEYFQIMQMKIQYTQVNLSAFACKLFHEDFSSICQSKIYSLHWALYPLWFQNKFESYEYNV